MFTDENEQIFIKTILDNTIYITYNELIGKANNCFKQFLINIERYLGIIIINSYEFINFLQNDFNNNIVIVDDCVFYGNDVTSFIDDLTYNPSIKLKCTKKEILDKINYHLVIPFQSEKNSITKFMVNNLFRYYDQNIKPISQILNENHYNIINKPKFTDLLNKFDCETDVFPFYSDIKVANKLGSFP